MGRAFTLGAVEDCLLEEKVEGRVHNSGDSPLIVAIPPDDCKRVLYTYTIRHQNPLGFLKHAVDRYEYLLWSAVPG